MSAKGGWNPTSMPPARRRRCRAYRRRRVRSDPAQHEYARCGGVWRKVPTRRTEEHTSELQSLMRISYAVFCLKKKKCGDLSLDMMLTVLHLLELVTSC